MATATATTEASGDVPEWFTDHFGHLIYAPLGHYFSEIHSPSMLSSETTEDLVQSVKKEDQDLMRGLLGMPKMQRLIKAQAPWWQKELSWPTMGLVILGGLALCTATVVWARREIRHLTNTSLQ